MLTGTWKLADFMVNGTYPLKKVDQDLWMWYTKHGPKQPCWYVSDHYVEDGGSWSNRRCLARIADVNTSPSGDIFIPHQSQTAANWVLTGASVFVPQMTYSLLQRYEAVLRQNQELKVENANLKQENEKLKMQADQLQLELQHLEKKHGQDLLEPAPSSVCAEGKGMPLLQPPPPPRVPDLGPYGKGKPAEEGEQGKGKSSPSAQWIAGQSGAKAPTGWKNYMVPLLAVAQLNSWCMLSLVGCMCCSCCACVQCI